MRKSCLYCRHWFQLDDPAREVFGTCRVRPPKPPDTPAVDPLEFSEDDFALDRLATARWPVVAAGHLCGRFDRKCVAQHVDCRELARSSTLGEGWSGIALCELHRAERAERRRSA